ncbi:phytoene desaturase family protein [Bacteroidota bacterium]
MSKRVAIIGAGFSGLSASCYLAKQGLNVSVYEKHAGPGGRAGILKEDGFTFDLGPSWYWMPDIFENFFNDFNKSASDYYKLKRLDPSYRIFYDKLDYIDIHASWDKLKELFEKLEPGSSKNLKKFLNDAELKYKIGVHNAAMKPGLSLLEYIDLEILIGFLHLDVLKPISKHINKLFSHEKLVRMLEFPVLFLGSTAQRIPSLYSLMNYADLVQGTFYPEGGFYSVIQGFYEQAKSLGVSFHFNAEVEQINIENKKASSINVNNEKINVDYILASADYYHIEKDLLQKKYRNYSEKYWEKREMAPSALLMFLGFNKKIEKLLHHNIFFDEELNDHAHQIYNDPMWPTKPCVYISCNSKTDSTASPKGCDNLVALIPVASGLKDSAEIKEKYLNYVIDKIEKNTGERIRSNLTYKKIYANSDFSQLFNAYNGNAYGLSNILRQTGILKPKLRNRKVKNLFYAGQLTVPGPGVPPAILSGKIVANELLKMV